MKTLYLNVLRLIPTGLVWMALFATNIEAANTGRSSTDQPIHSQEEAVLRAGAYLGIDGLPDSVTRDPKVNSRIEIMRNSTESYLGSEFKGSAAWVVDCDQLVLDLSRVPDKKSSKYPRDFQLVIDSTSGRLLHIVSDRSDLPPDSGSMCTIEYAARPFPRLGKETYLGIPDSLPQISFLQALDECPNLALGAKRIVAVFVMYARDNITRRPVWVLHGEGMPPFNRRSPDDPRVSTRSRAVVDATTGKRIFRAFF